MNTRKPKQLATVNVEWTINYEADYRQQEAWSRFCRNLISRTMCEANQSRVQVEVPKYPINDNNSTIHTKITYRCGRCGQTWLEKRDINGEKDPDWWKCPNGCYSK